MKCSCGIWVCPAFSLQKGRVDEVTQRAAGVRLGSAGGVAGNSGDGGGGGSSSNGVAALGIRMPPGMRKENL